MHFQAALVAYREGKYQRAVEELERALELDPSGKDLVYNLGLVHEKLGNLDRALFFFRRLLEMEPDPVERARVEAMVQRLAGARERQLRAGTSQRPDSAAAASDGEPSAAGSAPGRLDGWVWGTGGVALAALTVGVIFGVRAWATHPGASPSTGPGVSSSEVHGDARDAHRLALVADVSFGVALVSGAAAAWLYFGREAEPADRELRVRPSAIPYGISYGGRF